MTDSIIEQAKSSFAEQGYCVIENLLDAAEAERIDALGRSLMSHQTGYVKLEGALNQIPDLAPLCVHPTVLAVVEHILGEPFYLANNVCLMWCQPGAPGGGLHFDWPLDQVPEPWPGWPLLLQAMWMLTDFTADNGATRLVPGSHRASGPTKSAEWDAVERPIKGKRGSVLLWHGAALPRNGPNAAHSHRMGANAAYIPSLVHRPPSGWPLVQRTQFDRFPARLQELLERSVESNYRT